MSVKATQPGGQGPDKRIMVAVDSTESSGKAVMYVADMLGGQPGFHLTLFSLISVPPEDFFASASERDGWIAREEESARELLDGLREVCMQAGFRDEQVEVRSAARHCASVAECILEEARAISACTLVVGRRGVTMREEFLFGSTSSRVLHEARNCAVWVVE